VFNHVENRQVRFEEIVDATKMGMRCVLRFAEAARRIKALQGGMKIIIESEHWHNVISD